MQNPAIVNIQMNVPGSGNTNKTNNFNQFRKLMLKTKTTLQKMQFFVPNFGTSF